MRIFLFVRHGETDDNKNRVFQGHGGGALNTEGKSQARAIGERLRNAHIDAIFASDVVRTRETAEAIVRHHPSLTVQTDERLREVDVGAWQGLGQDEIETQFPSEWAAWRKGIDVRRGGGETYADTAIRAEAGIVAHTKDRTGTFVVVSHAGTIRAVVARMIGAPLERFAPVHNTALTVVEDTTERGMRLVLWNDVRHLDLGDPVGFLPKK
jgi:broad specificity phosphatase PhoE